MMEPQHILLFSGKRKSGKDYLTEELLKRLGPNHCEIVRISEPIKRFWSEQRDLDLSAMLSDGAYKESYRKEMIDWSDAQRSMDYGIFCREAMARRLGRPICIVSDVRRKTDLQFFAETYGSRTLTLIRIECDDAVRGTRGWHFQAGIDDIASECDLDDCDQGQWHYRFLNDGTRPAEELLRPLVAQLLTSAFS